MHRNQIFGLIFAMLALLFDQVTKAAVQVNAVKLIPGTPVLPGINFVYVLNDGVSFGLFGGTPSWILIAATISVCLGLFILLFRSTKIIETISLGAIIGGASGNIVDRIRQDAVTDFLDIYIGTSHWPAFNIADVFIVSGAILLIFTIWREQHL